MKKYISSREELARRLRHIRIYWDYSQLQISNYLGLDRSTYSYYEASKTLPNIFMLIRLSYFYNIDLGYFIDNDNNEFTKELIGFDDKIKSIED